MSDDTDGHVVGAVPLPLPEGVRSWAIYGGPQDCYRYTLKWRPVHPPMARRTIMWLMMNPSVAGHNGADRTVLRCWTYSTRWGFTDMLVGNSAAYRATDQMRLGEVDDPVGPENYRYLLSMAAEAHMVVAAYGTPKVPTARKFGPEAVRALRERGVNFHCLRRSKSGVPCHPLFLPMTLKPVPWEGIDGGL